ncbi:MAG: diacylglycerol kinase family lipid kinase [Clostridia bacterium]|nr:diacylglycerol kinase family lipid kinase [Clostridia bacterium]MBR5772746.1 diacylglycerol kinase family lipid kinase [Clostridia bacterium]
MKHYFIVNPEAGQGKNRAMDYIVPEIKKAAEKYGFEYEIMPTGKQGDGIEFTKSIGQKGEPARVYACGGDGTLYEVVNGAYGYSNLEVAVVPLGSGNDFVRYFGTKEDFLKLDDQIEGVPCELDLIKCGDEIAINQCSMGMDAEVCAMQGKIKKFPLVTGEGAYYIGCIYAIIKKFKNRFTVTYDDGTVIKKDALFCFIGNASYYGGGFRAAPLALPNDGLLDVVLVEASVSRAKLASLLNAYKRGEHLDWDITTFKRVKNVKIHSEKPAAVNVDGECQYVTDASFELIEKGIKFVVPKGSAFLNNTDKE